jgi:ABC-type bacteriocin/lantibiotic exporter with double-glycine peptidase domain
LQIIETIKSSGLEGDIFSRLSGQMAKMTNVQQESGSISNVLNSIYPLVTMLTTTTVLIVGAMRVIEGDLSIGTLVAFQSLMLCFLTPVVRIATLFQDVQQLHTSIERLDDVFHYPVCGCFTAKKSKKFKKAKLSGNLLVDNISFGYNPLEEPLIKNFSCELSPGKKIALVGKTGSGKSTISKLIAGLYQPWEGKILFDGEPCFSIPRNIFISSLAMVDQEVVLFAGTVRDNITMWNETISDNRIIQAAKDACIHEDIIAKFGGYEGKVNENGNNFSGGQRQLLEIARALVVDPSILILDEATSALDAYTEQKIQDNLNRVGCACLIVAHRLSTVKYCDEIIVIDNGEIIQRGTHEQLENEKEGLYYQLIRMY